MKHAAVVSVEHEDILWKKGVLGVASPESLLCAFFFILLVYSSAFEGAKNIMI